MLNSNLEREIRDAIAPVTQPLPEPPANQQPDPPPQPVTIWDVGRLLSENEPNQ
jgi:hypothetical protein